MRFGFVVFAFFCLLALPASAHPHIFARYNVEIAPGDAGFIALHFTFTFQGVPNPIMTPGDQPQIDQDMLANIAAHPFFLYLEMDGQSMGRQMVRPVSDKNHAGKDQTYSFDIFLPDTIKNFAFALYDPEYFVSVSQTGAGSVLSKIPHTACTVQDRTVGKTVWGILHAQYVMCGEKSGRQAPAPNFKMQPPGDSPANPPDTNRRDFVP